MGNKYTLDGGAEVVEVDEDDVYWAADMLLKGWSRMSLKRPLEERLFLHGRDWIRVSTIVLEAQKLIENNLTWPPGHPLASDPEKVDPPSPRSA